MVANFTQESKMGRQVIAKCRNLNQENMEQAQELAEGKVRCFAPHKFRSLQCNVFFSQRGQEIMELWSLGDVAQRKGAAGACLVCLCCSCRLGVMH